MSRKTFRFIELAHDTRNIGDDIQTVAVSQFIGELGGFCYRDRLREYDGLPAAVILNGWFSHRPQAWPPAARLTPVFVGFHVSGATAPSYAKHRDYLKAYEPIGCRDTATTELVRGWGINAYTSLCATLTFPARPHTPANGRVALIDTDDVYVPKALRRNAIRLTHVVPEVIGRETRMNYARDLLAYYRDNVSLVITTRLHVALPSLAMGIPVVFLADPHDSRLSVATEVGLPINRPVPRRGVGRMIGSALDKVDWSPRPVDVSQWAEAIRSDIRARVDRLM